MNFPWLTEIKSPDDDDTLYSLEEVFNKKYETIELIENTGWLVIFRKDEVVIDFAILQYVKQELYPEKGPVMTSLVFSGHGTTAGLRELRHTYWGEEGYLFYANGDLIIKAFQKLKEYFDF